MESSETVSFRFRVEPDEDQDGMLVDVVGVTEGLVTRDAIEKAHEPTRRGGELSEGFEAVAPMIHRIAANKLVEQGDVSHAPLLVEEADIP